MKQTNIYKKYISTIWFACVMIFFSQPILAQDITLQLKNVTVKEAIEALHKTKNYSVVIKSSEINMSKKVSINANNAPIKVVLDQIFVGQNVSYTINRHSIIISKKSDTGQQKSDEKKKQTITGVVYDEEGNPVIGASVMNKETAQGAITDLDGKFSLETSIPSTIDISYVGYEVATVHVKDGQTKTIRLVPSRLMIDEVVVVGYGSQRRSNLTGAVSTISSKELNNRPVVSAANALQGADPSVNLTFGTGSPESGYSLNIRGGISVNGGTPLVLCDGVEVPLNQVNANDIESISVLKDASSCAIYGAKASAGVVLITTKSGSAATKGKAKISYNGRFGWTQNTTSTDFIRTGYDYVTFANKFYHAYNGVNMYLYEDEELQKLYDRRNDMTENPERPWVEIGEDGKYYYYGNTDWYGYFYNRTRPQMEHNVSITGGGEKVNYYISGRYYQQYGMFNIDKDLYKDYSFRAKMDAQLNKWIKWSTNIGLDNNNYNYNGTSNYAMTIARLESNISPSFVPFNPDGTIVQYTNQLYANSPLGAGDGGYLTSRRGHNSKSRTLLSVVNQIDITLLQGLTLTANYSYQQRKQLYRYRNNSFEYSRSQGVTQTFTSGSIFNNYEEDESFPVTHMLNYYATFEHSWAKKHNLKIVAGSQYETYRNVNKNTSMTNLSNDNLDSFSAVTPESVLTVSQDISAYKTLGFFGRINYDYMGKYLLEVSCRADGSSRFAPKYRWGKFPSVAAAWIVSEEDFLRESNIFTFLKLRGGWGKTGNAYVGEYGWRTLYENADYENQPATRPSQIGNDRLKWEATEQVDLALDFGFLPNQRISGTLGFYKKKTDGLLYAYTMALSTGLETTQINFANIENKGIEFEIKANIIDNKDWNWFVGFNIGKNKNKITDIDAEYVSYPGSSYLGNTVIQEGKSLGLIYGYKTDGIFQTQEEVNRYEALNPDQPYQEAYGRKTMPGDLKYVDLSGDGYVNKVSGSTEDKTVIGCSRPDFEGGFATRLSWKGLKLSVQGTFSHGAQKIWMGEANMFNMAENQNTQSTALKRWTPENPSNKYPSIRYNFYYNDFGDNAVYDASYVKIQNINLEYSLPRHWVDKTRIFGNVSIFASANNVYTFTSYPGPSPESFSTDAIEGASVDNDMYPTTRTFNFGVKVTIK